MFVWGYAKVLLASLTTGAVIMLAVSAWQLRHGGVRDVFTRSARLALIVLVPAILLTMLVGDELGVVEARYQTMKIAAAEAQWSTWLWISLIGFILLYGTLGTIDLLLMLRYSRKELPPPRAEADADAPVPAVQY